ncbi:MAG: hypothetical protein V1837_06855 [Candidatus Woesearchaeota archaeon]
MKKHVLIAILFLSVCSMLSWSVAAGASTGYCGNGVINFGEKCESPGTADNSYCPESATTCSGQRTGERAEFGDCNTLCKCDYDTFTYSCVKDMCGAQCTTKEDCPQTTDKCVGNKLSVRPEFGMCHYNCNCQDTVFGPAKCVMDECGAACSQDYDCPQSTETCLGAKTGTRSVDGKCSSSCQCKETPFTYKCVANSCDAECGTKSDCTDLTTCGSNHKLGIRTATCKTNCMCQYDAFKYQCVKDQCGAVCSKDTDCNDNNPDTKDQCLNDCTCKHTPVPRCGDGIVGRGEQCEFPNTLDNNYCLESVNECKGLMHGERTAFGDCNSQCQCVKKPLVYSCVVGECGAQCATKEDCPQTTEKCFGTKLATRGPYAECHYNCICQEYSFSTPKCVKDACNAQCAVDTDCSQSTEVCKGTMMGTRSEFGKCTTGCLCSETSATNFKCVKGKCDAQCSQDSDCDANERCSGCMCV